MDPLPTQTSATEPPSRAYVEAIKAMSFDVLVRHINELETENKRLRAVIATSDPHTEFMNERRLRLEAEELATDLAAQNRRHLEGNDDG